MKRTKTQQALAIARELAKHAKSSVDFHNAFFGIGGKLSELFPAQHERDAFFKSAEYEEIFKLRAAMRRGEKSLG